MARRKVKPTTERTNAERIRVLKKLMTDSSLSSVAIAAILNVHEITVAKWRAGTHPVPEGSLKYLELLYSAKK
jgi:DNA-binding transcriptional regulator YiaG